MPALAVVLPLLLTGGAATADGLPADLATRAAGDTTTPVGPLPKAGQSAPAAPPADCGTQWSAPGASAPRPDIDKVTPHAIGLGSLITVRLAAGSGMSHLGCLSKAGIAPVLFIDGIGLPALKPLQAQPAGAAQNGVVITYRLLRSSADAAAWDELLRRSWQKEGQSFEVAIGIGERPPFAASSLAGATKVAFALRPVGPPFGLGLLLLAFLCVAWLSSRTEWARDRDSRVAASAGPAGSGRSFSLSRLQLAAWSVTVLACIVAGWVGTGALPPLTGALAAMMSISGVTAAAGAGVSVFRGVDVRASEGPWRDLVHDADGLAVHRLQALVVNVLLLVLVWQQLIADGAVATLEKEWSGLLGISAGIYTLGKTAESVFTK